MENLYDINNTEEFDEVILKDEKGNDCRFDHILTFIYDNDRYAALLPLDEIEGVNDDEVVFLKITRCDGEDFYETVTNDILLDELFDEFMRIIEELDDEEDED